MKFFEDAVIGEKVIHPVKHVLTEEEIIRMGKEWDPQPFHIDKEAAKNSIFGGLVASNVHLYGVSCKIGNSGIEKWAVVAGLGISNMKNHAPGRVGDTMMGHSTCISKKESGSKPGFGIIEHMVELVNQNQEIIFSYTVAGLYQMREPG